MFRRIFAAARELIRELRWGLELARSVGQPRHATRLTSLWLREPSGRRVYRVLSEDAIRATRRSDTVFVFGSGRSILDIDPEAWGWIAEHDTVAFSHFHRQRFVRVDYHLIAEVVDSLDTARSIAGNPCYASTIFILLKGWLAEASNEIVSGRLLPHGARIFRSVRVKRGRVAPPSTSFTEGLVHGSNSSLDVANFAYLMGWKRIVMVGVDLYNREYFWLPAGVARPDEKPSDTAASAFSGADRTVEIFDLWRERMAAEGVDLCVYDSRSLLAEVLPVFGWPNERTQQSGHIY